MRTELLLGPAAATAKMFNPEKPEGSDLAFVKDTTFEACKHASYVQMISRDWNVAAHKGCQFDRQHVAIALREAATKFHQLANEIEGSTS